MAERPDEEDVGRRREGAAAQAHMAHLRQRLTGLPTAVLVGYLDTMYPHLSEGCRAGLHLAMRQVPREEVAGLFAVLSPEYSEAESHAAFCAASLGAVYGALALSYVWCVQALEARGEDTFIAKTRLHLCLKHPVAAPPAAPPAAPVRASTQPQPDGQERQQRLL